MGIEEGWKDFGRDPSRVFIDNKETELKTNSEGKKYKIKTPEGKYIGGDYPDQVQQSGMEQPK